MAYAPHAVYETVQTSTADRPGLLLLLFDGADRFLRLSLEGLERGDAHDFAYPLTRAHAIIAELSNALDHEVGGELAANLGRLYDFMLRHLTAGLVARNGEHVARVRDLLRELRHAFVQAVREAPGDVR